MTDGPHRSLKMPPGWKKFAERADKKAYAPEEVRDALLAALEQDWRKEVPDSLCRTVRYILGDSQSSLFGDQRSERLEALHRKTAGYNLGNVFLDCVIQATELGRSGDEVLREAAGKALSDRAARGARQVEEHYCRKSTQHRAVHVRERIETVVTQSDITSMAGRLAGTDGNKEPRRLAETDGTKGPRRLAKRTRIDDGVRL